MIMNFFEALTKILFEAYQAGYKAGQLGEDIDDSFTDWWNDLFEN